MHNFANPSVISGFPASLCCNHQLSCGFQRNSQVPAALGFLKSILPAPILPHRQQVRHPRHLSGQSAGPSQAAAAPEPAHVPPPDLVPGALQVRCQVRTSLFSAVSDSSIERFIVAEWVPVEGEVVGERSSLRESSERRLCIERERGIKKELAAARKRIADRHDLEKKAYSRMFQ